MKIYNPDLVANPALVSISVVTKNALKSRLHCTSKLQTGPPKKEREAHALTRFIKTVVGDCMHRIFFTAKFTVLFYFTVYGRKNSSVNR